MLDFQVKTKSLDQSAYQSLSLLIKGQAITEHFSDEQVFGTEIIVDPLPLAEWFASNWWRLRWEPEKEGLNALQQLDWNLSHQLASAASGFIWPDVTFTSDDFAVHCLARQTQGEFCTIRYVRSLSEWLRAADFEAGIDAFINQQATAHPSSSLASLWQEVIDERRSDEATQWRKLEAKLGFDPDEAPEQLIQGLQNYYGAFGQSSVEELSSDTPQPKLLELIAELNSAFKQSKEIMAPDLTGVVELNNQAYEASLAPWKQAADKAARLRHKLGLNADECLENNRLLDYLELSKDFMQSNTANDLPSSGLKITSEQSRVLLRSARSTTQRFALTRLLADLIYTHSNESSHLLSVTSSKTSRQKFQRAFAQELLCPYQGLIEFMNTSNPTEEKLEAAANHFNVSPLAVRYTLENKRP